MIYTIALAGSTTHTLLCAETLLRNTNFKISWIMTPTPKILGRKQLLTKNPLHLFAEKNHFQHFLIDQSITNTTQQQFHNQNIAHPDFLLVVDFGYLVPDWLLRWPIYSALNIHPSLLPRWRGSSPGQFVLLYGEKKSAVTLMTMSQGLDTGDILYQEEFTVEPTWTQKEYYQKSFHSISQVFAQKILDFAEKKILPHPQPIVSPTLMARRLKKEDGFVAWDVLSNSLHNKEIKETATSQLLREVHSGIKKWPVVIAQATRAFSPWPTLWTLIQTAKGEKRMQIVQSTVSETGNLLLEKVKIEGEVTTEWENAQKTVI